MSKSPKLQNTDGKSADGMSPDAQQRQSVNDDDLPTCERLIAALDNRSAVIGILGLGYVGLPLMLRFSGLGYRVLGFDIDPEKVERLNVGGSYIEHIAAESIAAARANGFEATTDMSRASEADALIICVPTPLDRHRQPDLSFVLGTVDAIVPHLRPGQIVSLESTTWPGTTDEELRPRLERRSAARGTDRDDGRGELQVGRDVFLVFSPEREDPGNPDFTTQTIPKVCGGCTPTCLRVGIALYRQAVDRVVPVSSTRAAEMTKLLENIHRCVNIGLVNEMKIISDRMGIDIHEVVRAAATKPFGFVPYFPGPGIGGHCIPVDPFYLSWKAREYGVHTRFIELAGEVNESMPQWVVDRVQDALNSRRLAVRGSRVLVLGIAYKRDVDDMRESPAVRIMELLRKMGAQLSYSDPHVPVFPLMREHHFDLKSVELTPQSLAACDLALLTTDHRRFDYDMIRRHAPLIVDTRGVWAERTATIIRA